MKFFKSIAILLITLTSSGHSQNSFDFENVKISQEAIFLGLKTNQTVLSWKEAQDSGIKSRNFTLMLDEIAGPILARQWTYPGGGEWPLIDWSKVSSLANLIQDQRAVLETTHAVAQSDDEFARICLLWEVVLGSGGDAELWYEDWLLSLAKGSNSNQKRLFF